MFLIGLQRIRLCSSCLKHRCGTRTTVLLKINHPSFRSGQRNGRSLVVLAIASLTFPINKKVNNNKKYINYYSRSALKVMVLIARNYHPQHSLREGRLERYPMWAGRALEGSLCSSWASVAAAGFGGAAGRAGKTEGCPGFRCIIPRRSTMHR